MITFDFTTLDNPSLIQIATVLRGLDQDKLVKAVLMEINNELGERVKNKEELQKAKIVVLEEFKRLNKKD